MDTEIKEAYVGTSQELQIPGDLQTAYREIKSLVLEDTPKTSLYNTEGAIGNAVTRYYGSLEHFSRTEGRKAKYPRWIEYLSKFKGARGQDSKGVLIGWSDEH